MKNFIKDLTNKTILKAGKFYNKEFDLLDIRFDIKGKTAGMFCYGSKGTYLRYNLNIAKENKKTFYITVIHEVAHYIAKKLNKNKYIKPHGIEWKSVMNVLGISNPKRCHSYSMVNTLKGSGMRYFTYTCDCNETHQLSTILHNRVQRNSNYNRVCKICKSKLVKV